MNKPLCWIPYYSLDLSPTDNKPCCKIAKDQDFKNPISTAPDFFSDHYQQWLVDNFETADTLPKFCRACDVPQGSYSYRQHLQTQQFQRWPTPTAATRSVRKLLLGLDNICASSCIMCTSRFSTTIAQLQRSQSHEQLRRADTGKIFELDQFDLDSLVEILPQVQHLQLFGGEPLFSPNLPRLLTLLDQHAKSLVSIGFCTGLHSIKARWLDLLSEFKAQRPRLTISIMISQEAAPELNSWIRGIDAHELERNIALVRGHHTLNLHAVNTVIGSFNIWALPEMAQWISKTFGSITWTCSPLYTPPQLQVRQLPPQVKDIARQRLTAWQPQPWAVQARTTALNLLDQQPNTEWSWSQTLARMQAYPQWRGDTRTFDDVFYAVTGSRV